MMFQLCHYQPTVMVMNSSPSAVVVQQPGAISLMFNVSGGPELNTLYVAASEYGTSPEQI